MKYIFPLIFLMSCENLNEQPNNSDKNSKDPQNISYNILKIYAHDTSSFTEGLVWHDGYIYESTGLENRTKIFKKKLDTNLITQQYKIPDPTIFGEGITIYNNKIYQLTWKSHKVFVYNLKDFKKVADFVWPFEGWGITHNEKSLILSTGGSNLYFVNPENFKIEKTINVFDNYGYVGNLNELEYVDGFIYSNKFLSDDVLKINEINGKVEAIINMSGLLNKSGFEVNSNNYSANTGNILNGIAYDSITNHFFITGKLWPALFEIEIK